MEKIIKKTKQQQRNKVGFTKEEIDRIQGMED